MYGLGNRFWIRLITYAVIIVGGLLLGLGVAKTAYWVMGRYRIRIGSHFVINDYIRSHSLRRLQLGAGGNDLVGWLNTDINPGEGEAHLDVTERFPLSDRSFNYIFSEHLIEHVSYEDGFAMLNECYRVLAPGGKVRIATPNLLKFIRLFQDNKTIEMGHYMERKVQWHGWPWMPTPECFILNYELRSFGHQFLYDPGTLRDSLARAGFEMITEFPPGESDDSQLRGVEKRHNSSVRDVNDYETMVFQAARPHVRNVGR